MDGEDPTKLPRDPYEQVLDSGDVVSLTFLPLNESAAIDRVRDDRCGAIVAFVGTTRDNFQGEVMLERISLFRSASTLTVGDILVTDTVHIFCV